MTGGAARVAVAAVAIVVVAWLGIMERDHLLLSRGTAAAGFARADSDARAARFLNPDSVPDLYRAVRLDVAGRWRQALATVEQVLRREPDNLDAWNTLRFVARGHDPASVLRAAAAAHRLDPVDYQSG